MALDPGLTIAGIVVILALTVASAFFSSSEIAILSLAKHRIDALAADGSAAGRTLGRLRSDPHRLLVTVLEATETRIRRLRIERIEPGDL